MARRSCNATSDGRTAPARRRSPSERSGMSIADDVRAAGAFVRQADGATLDGAIAGFIGRFVAPAFSVSCAAIEDSDRVRTGTFAAVVHTDELHDGVVRADDAAVAI